MHHVQAKVAYNYPAGLRLPSLMTSILDFPFSFDQWQTVGLF